ncbi:MAG: cation:dicarboxylase symporter family transporter [Lachnospiraceae bacterium]|nr:cation:dicarboxylase symporter family transporter [Lachnospiraceae bacterium]
MLISEAVRGEGGRLFYEADGNRVYFMEKRFGEKGNLMPRDVVSRCMDETGRDVFLNITFLGKEEILRKLSEVYDLCLKYRGIDISKQCIPVSPSVHFFMGGIAVKNNPLHFLKRYASSMLQVFSMGSSNAAIPVNMQACEKMGVDKKVYCLSLPLGATLNMDGTCVYMAVFTLALARVYGIQITESSLAAMVISIIVLSMGAPGIPGSGLICLSMLLTQVGVPVEAVGLVMGIDSFVGMFRSMSNCTGDVAISILVAWLEKMLDMDKYNNVRVR